MVFIVAIVVVVVRDKVWFVSSSDMFIESVSVGLMEEGFNWEVNDSPRQIGLVLQWMQANTRMTPTCYHSFLYLMSLLFLSFSHSHSLSLFPSRSMCVFLFYWLTDVVFMNITRLTQWFFPGNSTIFFTIRVQTKGLLNALFSSSPVISIILVFSTFLMENIKMRSVLMRESERWIITLQTRQRDGTVREKWKKV